MLFLKRMDETGWSYDHQAYWNYLETIADRLPPYIAAFACDQNNYNLDHPNSLHDSWLESWNVREVCEGEDRAKRYLQVDARLLGSRWDRFISLTYRNVGHYKLDNPAMFVLPPSKETGHGDILVHEVRIAHNGSFAHEFLFSRGSRFLVEFEEFAHQIELL